MNMSSFVPPGNGSRARRTRPENVVLNIERVEHLITEIHAPGSTGVVDRDEIAAAPTRNGHDVAAPVQHGRDQELRKRYGLGNAT